MAASIPLFLGLLSSTADCTAQQVESYWSGGSGNWSDSSKWLPAGVVPNNTGSEEYAVTLDGDIVTVDVPTVISSLEVRVDRTLDVREALTTNALVLSNGYVENRSTLSVNGDLILKKGSLGSAGTGANGVYVGGDVIKRGYGRAYLGPFQGSADQNVVIEEGTLSLPAGRLGIEEKSYIVANPEFARILLRTNSPPERDIYLNNATGFGGTGAIVNSSSDDSSIFGDIYLGSEGSVLGIEGRIKIFGPIHGGSLEITGHGVAEIHGSDHTYSGATYIGATGGTTVQLREVGSLSGTSSIHVRSRGTLLLSNLEQSLDDRIPNTAPVFMHGGALAFDGSSNAYVVERVGPLHALQGASRVSANSTTNRFEFASLTHSEFATIEFTTTHTEPSIRFDSAPSIVNSILGSWATYRTVNDFATYDSTEGIVALGDRVARPTQIDGAGENDHVRTSGTPATLNADRTIATLAMGQTGGTFDLGKHRLTLGEGGLIIPSQSVEGAPRIGNGEITAGRSEDNSTLYAHAPATRETYKATISAAITDNEFGGRVSFVKSGNGAIELSGSNSYSGTTVVQAGRLWIQSTNSLPADGSLWVDSGNLVFAFQSPDPIQLSSLRLSSQGLIDYGIIGGHAILNAEEYHLESGNIGVQITGSGSMYKTTDGWVELQEDNVGYSGNIFVEEGVLVAGGQAVYSAPDALGKGQTTILPGGTLLHGTIAAGGGYYLLNSNLTLAGGDISFARSNASDLYTFAGQWAITAPSRLLMFNFEGEGPSFDTTIQRTVSFTDGGELIIPGEGLVTFEDGIQVAGDTAMELQGVIASIAGITAAAPSSLLLRGEGMYEVTGSIGTIDNGTLLMKVGQEVALGTRMGGMNIGPGVTLVLDGVASTGSLLDVDGGTLSGQGMAFNVRNLSGILAPGNGIGEFTAASLYQGEGGTLQMELGGSDMPIGDLLRGNSIRLAGLLDVQLAPQSEIAAGTTFDLVIADTIDLYDLQLATHGFAGKIDLVSLDSGPDSGKTALRLTILVPEPPAICLLLISFVGSLFWLRNRATPPRDLKQVTSLLERGRYVGAELGSCRRV